MKSLEAILAWFRQAPIQGKAKNLPVETEVRLREVPLGERDPAGTPEHLRFGPERWWTTRF